MSERIARTGTLCSPPHELGGLSRSSQTRSHAKSQRRSDLLSAPSTAQINTILPLGLPAAAAEIPLGRHLAAASPRYSPEQATQPKTPTT